MSGPIRPGRLNVSSRTPVLREDIANEARERTFQSVTYERVMRAPSHADNALPKSRPSFGFLLTSTV